MPRIISNRKKSEACNRPLIGFGAVSIISNRKKSEACNIGCEVTFLSFNYIQSEKVRGLQPLYADADGSGYYIQSEKVRGLQPRCVGVVDAAYYIQSEKVRGLQRAGVDWKIGKNYIQSEKVRGLQQHYASTNSTPINRLFRHFSPPKTKPLA